MASRDRFDAATALYEEAVAMYEAAKAEFESLKRAIAKTIRSGRAPTRDTLAEAEGVRSKLFVAAEMVSSRDRRRSERAFFSKQSSRSAAEREPEVLRATTLRIDGVELDVPQLSAKRSSDGASVIELMFSIDSHEIGIEKFAGPVLITLSIDDIVYSDSYELSVCTLGPEYSSFTFVRADRARRLPRPNTDLNG